MGAPDSAGSLGAVCPVDLLQTSYPVSAITGPAIPTVNAEPAQSVGVVGGPRNSRFRHRPSDTVLPTPCFRHRASPLSDGPKSPARDTVWGDAHLLRPGLAWDCIWARPTCASLF